jgi:hypothetical protein
MSSPRIADFFIDEENEQKFWAHGLSAEQVLQILGNEHVVVPNRRRRRGLQLVIGRDDGGACITVPVERTHDPSVWRPITAWLCKDWKRTKLD